MKYVTLLSFILICYIRSAAQTPKQETTALNDKLEQWRNYCNVLLESEMFDSLVIAAQKGLQMTPPDHWKKRAMFSLFGGVANNALGKDTLAESLLQETLLWGEKVDALDYQMTALNQLEGIYEKRRNHLKRKSVIDKMQSIAQAHPKESFKQLTLVALSSYYSNLGKYDIAIQYYLDAVASNKRLLDEHPDDKSHYLNIGLQLDNVGNLYNTTEQPTKALEYLREANPYIAASNDPRKKGKHFVYLMQAFSAVKKLDSLIVYYHQLRELHAQTPVFNEWALANISLAEYYIENNQVKDALHYALLAKDIAAKGASLTTQLLLVQSLGHAFLLAQEYRQAIAVFQNGLTYDLQNDKENEVTIRSGLASAYAAIHQWDSAYYHLDANVVLTELLNKELTNKNFAEVEGQYQNKIKQNQIETQTAALKFAKQQQWWMVGGMVMLTIMSLLLWVIYRNKRKSTVQLNSYNRELFALNQSLEEANKTKSKLFSIVAHDLRSPISHVYQYLHIIASTSTAISDEQKVQLGYKTQEASAALLQTMEDLLYWSKSQLDQFQLEEDNFHVAVLVKEVIALHQLQIDRKKLIMLTDLPADKRVWTDRNWLHTILRNLLHNAIKASDLEGTIHVFLEHDDDQAGIIIENNGATFTQKQYEEIVQENSINDTNGLGLQLVYELAKKAGMHISYINNGAYATRVQVLLKQHNPS